VNPDLRYFIAANKLPGLGPVKIKKALDHFGSISAFWSADAGQLRMVEGFSNDLVEAIVKARNDIDVEKELEKALKSGHQILTIEDEGYPSNLKNIYDPPPVIYIDGKLERTDGKAIAIVGTRKPTHYGKEVARNLAAELSGLGFTIVSGLAYGIDTEAHLGALEAGGRTISVFGSGLDHIYPESNKAVAKRISRAGANVSEFPLGQTPDKWTFPQRNRIISGLSLGVVVVEGSMDSGALITAKLGLEQGREVFAVPGNVRSEFSRGPHSLIKDGAKLVESIDDILDELNIYVERQAPGQVRDTTVLSEKEKQVVSALSYEPRPIDSIIEESKLTASEVLSVLSMLEMKRLVKQQLGRGYVLI